MMPVVLLGLVVPPNMAVNQTDWSCGRETIVKFLSKMWHSATLADERSQFFSKLGVATVHFFVFALDYRLEGMHFDSAFAQRFRLRDIRRL